MLFVLTAVFDNLIVGLSIVDYDPAKILGIHIGVAPVEDFMYALLAVNDLAQTGETSCLEHFRNCSSSRGQYLGPILPIHSPRPFHDWRYTRSDLLIATFYFLVPYNLLMYGVNDVFDYESDIRNPRKGGIEGAVEQKAFHPVILWSAILSNVPFLVYLFTVGSVAANIVLAVLVFFVLAYSLVGLRFKEVPVLDSVTSSIHFVGPMVYAMVLTGIEPSYAPYTLLSSCGVQPVMPSARSRLSLTAKASLLQSQPCLAPG